MLAHRRVTPSIKYAGTYLYTWVEKGTVRIRCLAQEHEAMFPASKASMASLLMVPLVMENTTNPFRLKKNSQTTFVEICYC